MLRMNTAKRDWCRSEADLTSTSYSFHCDTADPTDNTYVARAASVQQIVDSTWVIPFGVP